MLEGLTPSIEREKEATRDSDSEESDGDLLSTSERHKRTKDKMSLKELLEIDVKKEEAEATALTQQNTALFKVDPQDALQYPPE